MGRELYAVCDGCGEKKLVTGADTPSDWFRGWMSFPDRDRDSDMNFIACSKKCVLSTLRKAFADQDKPTVTDDEGREYELEDESDAVDMEGVRPADVVEEPRAQDEGPILVDSNDDEAWNALGPGLFSGGLGNYDGD